MGSRVGKAGCYKIPLSSCPIFKLFLVWTDRFSWRNNRRFGCSLVNDEYGLGHGWGCGGKVVGTL